MGNSKSNLDKLIKPSKLEEQVQLSKMLRAEHFPEIVDDPDQFYKLVL